MSYLRLKSPLVAQIELTEKCNNSCLHCYNFWRDKQTKISVGKDLSEADARRVIAALSECEVFHVVLTGGEPFLNRAALRAILEETRNAGITVSLNSTLSCLLRRDLDYLDRAKIAGVLVSILGSTAEKHDAIAQRRGAFAGTMRGIAMLQAASITLNVNMVVSKKNLDDIGSVARLVKSIGINGFYATRAGCPGNCADFSDLGLTQKEFNSYLETLAAASEKEHLKSGFLESYPLCGMDNLDRYTRFLGRRCLAGITSMTIAPDGNVRPCSHLDTGYGNLLTEGLPTVWGKMTEWSEDKFLPTTCRSCKLLKHCGGGCRMEAKTLSGSLSGDDPYACPANVDRASDCLKKIYAAKAAPVLPLQFRLSQSARIRTEGFGCIVFAGPRANCLLNGAGTKIVQMMKNAGKTYRLEDFCTDGVSSDAVRKVLLPLYEKGIILPR